MNRVYHSDQEFVKWEAAVTPVIVAEYDNCVFRGCDWQSAVLARSHFIDCRFEDCNLSLANLTDTVFRDVRFLRCKMLGLRFDTCSKFGLSFSVESCQLNHSHFLDVSVRDTLFSELIQLIVNGLIKYPVSGKLNQSPIFCNNPDLPDTFVSVGL